MEGEIADFVPVRFEVVRTRTEGCLWTELIRGHHYLGHRVLVGRSLKYLVYARSRVIAAIGWQSAVRHLACRDRVVGWTLEQREQHLHRVANNARFLILPWVRIRHGASHILSRNIRRLNEDWQRRYGYELWLLESFVDRSRFSGSSYRAANWVGIGWTKGYGKRQGEFVHHGQSKEAYVYALEKRMRRKITGDESQPLLSREFLLSIRAEQSRSKRRKRMIIRHEGWDPKIEPGCEITEADVDRLAQELEKFHKSFEGGFRRVEQVELSRRYLQGLLSDVERKSVEPMALALEGPKDVRNLQRFMGQYKWDEVYIGHRHREEAAETVDAEDGVVQVDSSEFGKKGRESVGVARQYCGRLGKIENCQSGVFLSYASSRGYALLDRRLYMPQSWFSDEQAQRRQKCKVPEELRFKTKPQLAAEMVAQLAMSGLFRFRWVVCDTVFGQSEEFLCCIPQGVHYLAEVARTRKVWKACGVSADSQIPAARAVAEIAKEEDLLWYRVKLAEGAKGPIVAEASRLRVRLSAQCDEDKERWLFLRKDPFTGGISYFLSNAPLDTSYDEMLRVCTLRWPIEQCFEEGKSELGMDHYEHRSWPAWHRHMTFVFLAQLFLLRMRIALKKNPGVDFAAGPSDPQCGPAAETVRPKLCD
jgi:SRSO17 transposase